MTEKAEAKYQQLWAAYALARAQRRDCLSRDLPETAEAFAEQDLAAEDGPVQAHLSVLAAERKALRKLVKYARKHGRDVLPAAPPEVPAPAEPKPAAARASSPKPSGKSAKSSTPAKSSTRAKSSTPAKSTTAAPVRRGKAAAEAAPAAAPKVRARAKAGVSPAALATAEVPPTPPARPRRSPAKAKPLRPRSPAGPAKS